MKTVSKILIATLIVLINSDVFAQWTAIWTNNSTDLKGGCFATSKNSCFVANNSGKIYRTSNGGTTWDSVQTIFTSSWFNDIYFPSINVGYACGGTAFGSHYGIIAKTTNGGATWDSITSNVFAFDFTKMFFVNDNIGYIGGDNFVKTMDGCASFSSIPLPFSYSKINAISFFDSNNGLIAAHTYTNPSKYVYRIARTSDGGVNWITTYIDSSIVTNQWSSKTINAISFSNSLNGCAVGDNGILLTTTNGGFNWVKSSLASDSSQVADIVLSKNSMVGYAVGWKPKSPIPEGRIYKTFDGGLSWQQNINNPIAVGIYSVSMANEVTIYTTGFKNVFKTINGGGITEIFENPEKKKELKIIPNPINESGKIEISDELLRKGNLKLKVWDDMGRIVNSFDVTNQGSFILNKEKFAEGIYFYQLEDNKEVLSKGKFMIQ